MGRSTQGVSLIHLDQGTTLAGIEKVLESDDENNGDIVEIEPGAATLPEDESGTDTPAEGNAED
jgi:DNA gyrase subunit A